MRGPLVDGWERANVGVVENISTARRYGVVAMVQVRKRMLCACVSYLSVINI